MEGFWLFLAIVVVARSSIGRAIADRISGRVRSSEDPAVIEELDSLKHRLGELESQNAELEDRLEFTERLLQQRRNQEGLPPIT